ncbi:MAG: 2-oxoglutarate dehydrogenase, E2 component, dihydrolipoamide succinyltransferase [Balneolaceae bacterium]
MARVEVVMPEMGESVMEGTVIEWSKQVGDKVETDEPLLEIATDKVDTEVPSPETGILMEILVEEGDTVEVGNPIAVIETDPEAAEQSDSSGSGAKSAEEADTDAAAEKEETEEPVQNEEPVAEEPVKSETSKSSGEGERVEVVMPQMGESVMEGTIIEWSKNVGDTVEMDEALLEIATDKVDTEVPSPESGTLVEILVEAGDTVEVGQTIAIIETGARQVDTRETKDRKQPAASPQKEIEQRESMPSSESTNGEQKAEPVPAGDSDSEPQRIGKDGRFYSPLVRSIAREEGISQQELESIEGSGKEGRVSKEDILSYVEKRKAGEIEPPEKPAARRSAESKGKISAGELRVQRPSENVEIIKMDHMRKMIADHMVRSKQTSAHVSTFAEVDVTNVVRWREANKRDFQQKADVKLTYTPIFIESIIQAIREFPLINSSVEGDEIHVKKDINFGLAVALGEGGQGGLIVPVIKQAQDKNLAGLAKVVSTLAAKARNKNLSPDDLVGGTITLTNYGSVGNLMGTPIINQPQVAIIGTGVIQKRPVVMEAEGGDMIAIRHMMYLSMSYDHRIIDGAHGGAFLSRIKELLEDFDPDRPV